MSKIVKNNIDYIGSTYQSLPAQSGGTATSLVTTGEKYVWNNLVNSSVRVFLDQPTVPYTEGDIWFEDDSISYCNTTKATGSFDEEDWTSAIDAVTEETLEQTIGRASQLVTGNSGGKIIWRDADGDNQPDEIVITNNPDLTVTTQGTNVWKFNSTNGFCFSSTGYAGPYTTIIDANGNGVADFLTAGSINAAQVAIRNFSAAMINGGKLVRGGLDNEKGTIEIQDAQNVPIGEVNKDGFKFYGAGNVGQRSWVEFSTTNFFAGYDANNNQLFKVAGDEFQMQKCNILGEMKLGGKLNFVPITITDGNNNIINDGIAIVGV